MDRAVKRTARSRRTLALTALALLAFAANSVLNRMALGAGQIDAAGFAIIRLLSGALVLVLILYARSGRNRPQFTGSWTSATLLFGYAVAFSFAYLSLGTATGALILFGAVQITMIVAVVCSGHRLHLAEYAGVLLAVSGFVVLLLPGLTAPSILGAVLMGAAGVCWGFYSLRGAQGKDPLADTAFNFLRSLLWVAPLGLLFLGSLHLSVRGVVLAVLSGGLMSGVGYTLWYAALRGLTATQAAVVQLLVPPITAFGGVLLLGEFITLRLVVSSLLILGGVGVVVSARTSI